MATTTGPHTSDSPSPKPGPGGYGVAGRSEWLDVDWRQHLRSIVLHGSRVNYIEMGDGPAVVLRPRPLRLLAELAREHPPASHGATG